MEALFGSVSLSHGKPISLLLATTVFVVVSVSEVEVSEAVEISLAVLSAVSAKTPVVKTESDSKTLAHIDKNLCFLTVYPPTDMI